MVIKLFLANKELDTFILTDKEAEECSYGDHSIEFESRGKRYCFNGTYLVKEDI